MKKMIYGSLWLVVLLVCWGLHERARQQLGEARRVNESLSEQLKALESQPAFAEVEETRATLRDGAEWPPLKTWFERRRQSQLQDLKKVIREPGGRLQW